MSACITFAATASASSIVKSVVVSFVRNVAALDGVKPVGFSIAAHVSVTSATKEMKMNRKMHRQQHLRRWAVLCVFCRMYTCAPVIRVAREYRFLGCGLIFLCHDMTVKPQWVGKVLMWSTFFIGCLCSRVDKHKHHGCHARF
jgi:hypothetical protein